MTRKLVIEITDDEGRVNVFKRRDGVAKLLDNIDTIFKRGTAGRAIKGVKMFFTEEAGAAVTVAGGHILTENELAAEAGADTQETTHSG